MTPCVLLVLIVHRPYYGIRGELGQGGMRHRVDIGPPFRHTKARLHGNPSRGTFVSPCDAQE